MKKSSVLLEYLRFLRERKKFWMIPIVLLFFLMGTLVVILEGSTLAPFIYAIF